MSEWSKPTGGSTGESVKKRWQRIMEAPDSASFYDLSTGKRYTRAMFRPLHRSELGNVVDEFEIIDTKERVYVPFLRFFGDGQRCSLVGGNSQ